MISKFRLNTDWETLVLKSQIIDDLFWEYTHVSIEVEQGRLALDAPEVLALSARITKATATLTGSGPRTPS